jgi:Cu-Zn family superoxide dismutase
VNRRLLLALVPTLLAAPVTGQEASETDSLAVEIVGLEGERVGTAWLVEGASGILVRVALSGLPSGEHALHVHEVGSCEPPFDSAGGHLRELGTSHGFLADGGGHIGDLPNVTVSLDGEARVEAFLTSVWFLGEGAVLLDADDSALVVHAGPDDHRSDPAGNAGGRIACGRIAR